jgi:PKD repeat protein
MSLRELFRHKLENAEIIPDASVNSKLMHKLARQEFLHFNPVRLNVYYLGGILVAGIMAGIIFSSASRKSDHLTTPAISNEITKTDISDHQMVPAQQTDLQKPVISNRNLKNNKVVISTKVKSEAGNSSKPYQIPESRKNNLVTKTDISDSFDKTGLFNDASSVKNKLQSGLKSGEALFETSITEGCTPLKLRFINKSNAFDSCMWSFGDGGYSTEKNPEWIFDVEGEYKVVLQVFGSDGMQTISSSVITVYPKPLARFEIAPEKAILPEDEVRFNNYSTNAVSYIWDFGDGSSSNLFEPRHRYEKFGNYDVSLVVSSDYGCTDSLIVLNAFSGSEFYINFPNAFIPNPQGPSGGYYSSKSDESAQVFHPVSSGISDYQLKIFSKRGILIFETNDIHVGWDGYFKGQLCDPGVYIYKVRGNFRNGEPFIKMGDITLLKN